MDLTVPVFLGYFKGNHIITTQPDKVDAPMFHHNVSDYAAIQTRNLNECGVFFTVNELDQSLDPVGPSGKKRYRTKKMLKRIRAVFADDDEIRTESRKDWPLEPSLVVNSSPGKYHYYWLLTDDQDVDPGEWVLVQKGLNKKFGTDESASQVNRVLRLPGYYHHKKEPHLVTYTASEHRYGWDILKGAFPPMTPAQQAEEKQHTSNWLQHLQKIADNKAENAHPNYVAAAMSLASIGTDIQATQILIQGAVRAMFADAGREFEEWRPARIEEAVKSAYAIVAQEEAEKLISVSEPAVSESGTTYEYTQLPVPGGGLWHFVQWVKTIMRYPNETIAIAVAEHIVSVFGGGKWCLMGNTTTRKRIVLGPPGCGKNAIVSAIDQICVAMEQPNPGGVPYVLGIREYIGSDSFTFANQHKQMENHRVRSFVVNEAGQSKSSQAGDKDTLHAYQLQALSTKAAQSLKPREFSIKSTKHENQLKQVYGGVWVWYHESVVGSYAKVLHEENAFETGDFSRSDPIFVDPQIKVINQSASDTGLPDMVRHMIINMVNDFQSSCITRGDTPEVCNQWQEVDFSEVADRLSGMELEIVNSRNVAYGKEDIILISNLARRFEKIVTTLLLCCVADAAMELQMGRPRVTHAHLDYAIARQDAIDGALAWHTNSGRLSQLPDQITEWFVNGVKRGGSTLGRYSARGFPLEIKDTYIQQRLSRNRDFIKWTEQVFNGDRNRAMRNIIEEMLTRNILAVTYEVNSDRVDKTRFSVHPDIVTKKMVNDRDFFKANKVAGKEGKSV